MATRNDVPNPELEEALVRMEIYASDLKMSVMCLHKSNISFAMFLKKERPARSEEEIRAEAPPVWEDS